MKTGWYRRSTESEEFFDGNSFTGQTRRIGERSGDGHPLFVYEDAALVPGPASHPRVLDQHKHAGWRQVTMSRTQFIGAWALALVVALFAVWLFLLT